jgi:hypothetical protein
LPIGAILKNPTKDGRNQLLKPSVGGNKKILNIACGYIFKLKL